MLLSLNLTQPCDLNLTFAGIMNKDELYMQRCLQLAQNGLGTTYPNPLVGSVIVYENKIISEGWHQKAGKPHAEVNAINNAIIKLGEEKFEKIAPKCSIYVNLEPCSHTGKTPPCALLLVRYNFKEVIVGTLDPHDKVAGRGIKILEEAGISCKTGILVDKCNEVNKRFFSFHKYKKPYVLLKWAQTNDGYIAPEFKTKKQPVWITNSYSLQRVHQQRSTENAILIGAGTALADNPSLTTRNWKGTHPFRFVLANKKELPKNLNIFQSPNPAQILDIPLSDIKTVLQELYKKDIQSVIVEGGSKTLQAFIDTELWDEAHIYTSENTLFHSGVKAPELDNQQLKNHFNIKGDTLRIYQRL